MLADYCSFDSGFNACRLRIQFRLRWRTGSGNIYRDTDACWRRSYRLERL